MALAVRAATRCGRDARAPPPGSSASLRSVPESGPESTRRGAVDAKLSRVDEGAWLLRARMATWWCDERSSLLNRSWSACPCASPTPCSDAYLACVSSLETGVAHARIEHLRPRVSSHGPSSGPVSGVGPPKGFAVGERASDSPSSLPETTSYVTASVKRCARLRVVGFPDRRAPLDLRDFRIRLRFGESGSGSWVGRRARRRCARIPSAASHQPAPQAPPTLETMTNSGRAAGGMRSEPSGDSREAAEQTSRMPASAVVEAVSELLTPLAASSRPQMR